MNFAPGPFTPEFRPAGDPPALLRLLAAAPAGLTRQQILKRWPAGHSAPAEVSLWRWLMRGARDGTIVRTGTGKRGKPFVYRLAAFESPAGAVAEPRY